jgi:hypothetical protein
VLWKPIPSILFPDRQPSPRRHSGGGDAAISAAPVAAATPTAAPQRYRPPGSTGSLSSFMRDSTPSVPVGKVKKEVVPVAGGGKCCHFR